MAVTPRQPTRDPRKVEVLEFFAYSCGHCHAFEPALDAWQRALPPDVLFRRIPVAFRDELVPHNYLYFALEALGLVESMHRKVFDAIHVGGEKFDHPDAVARFADRHRLDTPQLMTAISSFAVASKAKQAFALAQGYKIDGTPALGVDGRWLTSGAMVGTNLKSLAVAEFLIGLARKKR